jgi:hypothetical protein
LASNAPGAGLKGSCGPEAPIGGYYEGVYEQCKKKKKKKKGLSEHRHTHTLGYSRDSTVITKANAISHRI